MKRSTIRYVLPPAPEGKQNYEAGFKKKGLGKIKWVQGCFNNSKEAREKLRAYVNNEYPNKGLLLYAGPLLIK